MLGNMLIISEAHIVICYLNPFHATYQKEKEAMV